MGLPTHLSEADIEEFGREVEAIRREVMSSLGEQDRAYIVRLIRKQRALALSGRLVMLAAPALLPGFGLVNALLAARLNAGLWPFFALLGLGTVLLGAAKILVAWPTLTVLVTLWVALPMGVSPAVVVPLTFASVALANFGACAIRNIWSNMIIFCGHFPAGVHHFTLDDLRGETRARGYVRQLMGSCNISGGKLLHLMSGNLSHQIEHHLFPDMPSNRYVQVAPRVRALAARYRLPYNTGSLLRQYGTTTLTIWRLWLPFGGKSSPQPVRHARA